MGPGKCYPLSRYPLREVDSIMQTVPHNSCSTWTLVSDIVLLQDPESQFIMPEGASQRRGRFELAFSQIGGSVCLGLYLFVHFYHVSSDRTLYAMAMCLSVCHKLLLYQNGWTWDNITSVTGTLVCYCQRTSWNLNGVAPNKSTKCRWGRQNRRLLTNNSPYLENGTR